MAIGTIYYSKIVSKFMVHQFVPFVSWSNPPGFIDDDPGRKAKIWDPRKGAGPGGRCLQAFSHTDLVNSVEFLGEEKASVPEMRQEEQFLK